MKRIRKLSWLDCILSMKFAGQLELGKLGARNRKLPYFEESKDKRIVTNLDLRSTRSPINGIGVYGPRI